MDPLYLKVASRVTCQRTSPFAFWKTTVLEADFVEVALAAEISVGSVGYSYIITLHVIISESSSANRDEHCDNNS